MTPLISYIICTSPRSGSTLLSTALWQTGIAGKPYEYFNPSLQDEVMCGRTLRVTKDSEYMEKIIAASTTSNGVYGMKLHAFQTSFFKSKIEQHKGIGFTSLHKAIEAEFPNVRYIFLERKNAKVRQAISYYRALMTNEWQRFQNTKAPEADAMIEYYELGIHKCLVDIMRSDLYWERYFTENNLSPLRLSFEEIGADYVGIVRRSLEYIGVSPDVVIAPPATVKISNERSAIWEQKYIDSIGSDILPTPDPLETGWAPF